MPGHRSRRASPAGTAGVDITAGVARAIRHLGPLTLASQNTINIKGSNVRISGIPAWRSTFGNTCGRAPKNEPYAMNIANSIRHR